MPGLQYSGNCARAPQAPNGLLSRLTALVASGQLHEAVTLQSYDFGVYQPAFAAGAAPRKAGLAQFAAGISGLVTREVTGLEISERPRHVQPSPAVAVPRSQRRRALTNPVQQRAIPAGRLGACRIWAIVASMMGEGGHFFDRLRRIAVPI